MNAAYLLLIVVAAFFLSGIKIAHENQRFAVWVLGRFQGFKGPGLLMKFSGKETTTWVRISVGDRGELVAPDAVQLGDVQVPMETDSNIAVGSIVRVVGFKESSLIGMPNPDQSRTITCQKCGHEMAI